MTAIEIDPVGYLGPMPVDRIISWSLTAAAIWIVGVIAFIVLRLVFKSRWETFVSRWRTSDHRDEASDDPALDPPLESPSGEAIFENAVTEAVASAVEALHALPTEAWVTWRLADMVRDRMDAATAATREHLATERKAQTTGKATR